MCLGEHGNTIEEPRLSRRHVLKGAGLAVPAAVIGSQVAGGRPAVAGIPGAWSMAMHLHGSFSEGYGSMSGHLAQAKLHGVDVVWWTDHDDTLTARDARGTVHFTSLAEEQGKGPPWLWTQRRAGPLTASSGGGVVASPASPVDPVAAGSLRLSAQSTSSSRASVSYSPQQTAPNRTWKTNLTQQRIQVEVLPGAVGPDAYLELWITSSWHPATAGRSAGQYALSYRIGGRQAPGTRRSADRLGTVSLAFRPGTWTSLDLHPDRDFAALFPEIDSRDLNLWEFGFSAVSTAKALAAGHVDYLRFTRPTAGEAALVVQRDVMAGYAADYSTVAQRRGLEVSRFQPHLNWYGGAISLPTYPGVTDENYFDYVRQVLVPDIHAGGGVASYNHPFGVSLEAPPSAAVQDEVLRQLAATILPLRACGVDVLEVGYPRRGGADLAHHLGLWDVLSRNSIFVTGNGVSDDHAGTSWPRATAGANWLTWAWAGDKTQASLLAALRAGRAWCASMTSYRGAMDLRVDGSSPMGSVSVATLASRSLAVTATGLPVGATVQVVRGVVDNAGVADPRPRTAVVGTLTAGDLSRGQAVLSVDTSSSCFVRTQVRDGRGSIVATSNPVWLLRRAPTTGIPAARQG